MKGSYQTIDRLTTKLTRNSLAKLRTNYIDILYVHWWDWDTSIEEVMNGLHNLVASGKVLYLVRNSISGCRHGC